MSSIRVIGALIALILVLAIIVIAYRSLWGGIESKPEVTTVTPGNVRLTVVTRLAPEEGEALRSRFLASSIAREYSIVDVTFLKEDVSKWPLYAEEGRADLFLIGGYAVYKDLCDKGYFKPIADPEVLRLAESIGAQVYRDSLGRVCFIAVSRTIFSYTVNTEFLSKYNLGAPTSWGDLLNPIYAKPLLVGESLVSFPKPSKSTTAARTIQLILQKYGWSEGWALLTVIGANSYIVESSEKARDDVALGVSGLAPTVLVYGIRAEEASGGKARFVAARGEVLPDVSPVAIAKNTGNERAALAFIKWLLSPEGQRALAELFYYLPYVKPEGTILERLYEEVKPNIFNYDPEDAARWERAAIYYFEAAIADPDANTLLKRIWAKVVELHSKRLMGDGEVRELALRLGSPLTISIDGSIVTFTKEYAIEINKRVAEDAVFRSMFMKAVKEAALERYEGILAELESRS